MKEIKHNFSHFPYHCEKAISCILIVSEISSKFSHFHPSNHGLCMFFIPAVTSQGHCERPNSASSQEAVFLQPLQVQGRLWRSLGKEKGQLEVALYSSTFLPPREQKCLLVVRDFPKGRVANRREATTQMCLVRESAPESPT